MRILTVSDEECLALWDHYAPGKLEGYDLILSAGDLKADYLSFLVTMAHAPVLYVHGNHDEGYARRPPEGCDCIDDQLVVYRGLRILGLGGCLQYRPDAPWQFTERQMAKRIRKLRLALLRAGGVDIIVTHAPPRGLGDEEDLPHRGFVCFQKLLDRYHPLCLVHGHVHLRGWPLPDRELLYGSTRIVNASERYVLDLPDRPFKPEERYALRWVTRHREPEELTCKL
ncbi:MAG: metallophosphoesterase [Clostridia bacterium]|nr:metallophosphoesterase [Clostridia bacterium]